MSHDGYTDSATYVWIARECSVGLIWLPLLDMQNRHAVCLYDVVMWVPSEVKW